MAEDFSKLRILAKRLARTHFKEQWNWRVEVHPPAWAVKSDLIASPSLMSPLTKGGELNFREFDLFARDISYSPTEIETDQVKAGAVTLNFPIGAAPVSATMTMRDHQDGRVSKWFDSLAHLVVNSDGTVNLPYGERGYLCTFDLFAISDESMVPAYSWKVLPLKSGDMQAAVDGEGFAEFPLSFMQFRSLGD